MMSLDVEAGLVMAGLVPAIHALLFSQPQFVDARHKAGHDQAIHLFRQ